MSDPQPPGKDEKLKNLADSLSEELGTDPLANKLSSTIVGAPADMGTVDVKDSAATGPGEVKVGGGPPPPTGGVSQDEVSLDAMGTVTAPAAAPATPVGKVEAPLPPAQKPAEEVLSLEDLDHILNAQDPSFAKDMDALQANLAATAAELNVKPLDLDGEILRPAFAEREIPKKSTFISRAVMNLTFSISKKIDFISAVFTQVVSALRIARKGAVPFLKRTLLRLQAQFVMAWKWLVSLSRIQKVNLVLFITVSIGMVVVVGRALRGEKIIAPAESPFLKSFEPVATRIQDLKLDEPVELFDNPLRNPEYVVLYGKMFVNLKASAGHRNPMAAFEIFIEANSQESAIELKDREKQFKDIIARVFEAMPYEEVSTIEGKSKLKLIIRRDVNQVINKGRVKKVYFKTFFYKS